MNTLSLSLVPAFWTKQLPSMKSLNLCVFFWSDAGSQRISKRVGNFFKADAVERVPTVAEAWDLQYAKVKNACLLEKLNE
jgi:hypothetical protein